jgi:GT2 family glycosyltransferase
VKARGIKHCGILSRWWAARGPARTAESEASPVAAQPIGRHETEGDTSAHQQPVSAGAAGRRDVEHLQHRPRVSLITVVRDTVEPWLRTMIASVRAQTYPRWELCVVDQTINPRMRAVLERLASTDRRIRVQRGRRDAGWAEAAGQALKAAKGEFVALLDHRDELSPEALLAMVKRLNEDPELDVIYSDEDRIDTDGRYVEPFYKPGWGPDLLLSMNFLASLVVLRRALVEDVGGFRPGLDGSEDYDLLLRVTERTTRIAHIPRILYHRRKVAGCGSTNHAVTALRDEQARRVLEDALRRRGHQGRVERAPTGRYTVRYTLRDRPKVSIIIPTRDRVDLLRPCIESIETMTDYSPYEILVLDNDSVEPATKEYLLAIQGKWRVVPCPGPFNFARINNAGVAQATGDCLLFLNNDTRVRRREWLTAMVEQTQRHDVGAVGARLLYPDARIQHAGVVLGVLGVAGHAFRYCPSEAPTYFDLATVVRNVSAVTGACMLVPRRVFEGVGGFDERFAVAFNDVDLCCRIRERGYLIVYTPLAELSHVESASRNDLHPSADDALMWQIWGDAIRAGDPYYNPNLTRTQEDWSVVAEADPADRRMPASPVLST